MPEVISPLSAPPLDLKTVVPHTARLHSSPSISFHTRPSGVGSMEIQSWWLCHLGFWGFAWQSTWFQSDLSKKGTYWPLQLKSRTGFTYGRDSGSFLPFAVCCVGIYLGFTEAEWCWQLQPHILSHSCLRVSAKVSSYFIGSGQVRFIVNPIPVVAFPQRR